MNNNKSNRIRSNVTLIWLNYKFTSLQFTVYSLQLTVYTLQFTAYSLQFTRLQVYSLQFTSLQVYTPDKKIPFVIPRLDIIT